LRGKKITEERGHCQNKICERNRSGERERSEGNDMEEAKGRGRKEKDLQLSV